jgi:hypothetical protein
VSVLQLLSDAGSSRFHDVCGVVAGFLDPLSLHTLRRVSRDWLRLLDSLGLAKQPLLILTKRCHPCGSDCMYHDCGVISPYACWRAEFANQRSSIRTPYVLSSAPGDPTVFDTHRVPGEFRVAWSATGLMDFRLSRRIGVNWCETALMEWASAFSVQPNGAIAYNTSSRSLDWDSRLQWWKCELDPAGPFLPAPVLLGVKLVYQ